MLEFSAVPYPRSRAVVVFDIRKPVVRHLSVKTFYFIFLKSAGSGFFLGSGGLRQYNNFFFLALCMMYNLLSIDRIAALILGLGSA